MKLLSILFLAMATMVQAATTIQTDLPLKYLVSESKSGKENTALIIFIHGYGSNEEDLFELKQEFSPDYHYVSVQAPGKLAPGSYEWYALQPEQKNNIEATVKKNAKLLEDTITGLTKKYKTQADKVILIGFSQGGMMSFEIGLRNPLLVRGIAPLSGKILPALKETIKPGQDLSHLAVFIGHGTIDDRVPLREATEAQALLEKTSIKPVLHTYPRMGHSINQQELTDLKKWLEETLAAKR